MNKGRFGRIGRIFKIIRKINLKIKLKIILELISFYINLIYLPNVPNVPYSFFSNFRFNIPPKLFLKPLIINVFKTSFFLIVWFQGWSGPLHQSNKKELDFKDIDIIIFIFQTIN